MGGKKKQSLKQMEKAQTKTKTSKKEKRTTAATSERKAIPGITPPNLSDKFKNDLKKMKVITPYALASRFDLRLSTARTCLNELERKGIIQFVSKSRNLVIYKPAE